MRHGPARPRVAILKDAFIPDYRVRLYEHLGEMPEVEYIVFHGDAPSATGHRAAPGPFSFPDARVSSHELRIGGKTLVYQSAISEIASGRFDGAVIGAELKLLANSALFPLLKARKKPVLLWGQGIEKQEDRGAAMRRLSGAGDLLKRFAARRADHYLVYTAGGRDRLVEIGVEGDRVSVLRNTLDLEAEIEVQQSLRGESETSLREELGLAPDSVVLLFIGRIYREKRLSEFISTVRALAGREAAPFQVEGLVVGDGPDSKRAREDAGDLECIHFLGEVREREQVARCMKVASAVVIPGAVGLAVNHAFAHGVPVVTQRSRLHGPEYEYLEPGRNSIVASGGAEDFVRAVSQLVDSPELRRTLAAGALESRANLTVAAMANSFHRAVCSAMNGKL